MAGEWGVVPIGELAKIYDGPHATPSKTNDGPVFLGISNLAQGRIDLANSEHLSEDDYTRWTRRVEPRAGDVVFSYETRLGEAAIIPRGLRCCLGRRMGLLRAYARKVDERFLLYAYLGPQFQETLRSRTVHGSTVDRIPLIDMPSFPIEVPASIAEQRAIAHILGTLDDKIELNRRMNETLEAMARALFKSWFVDFDPVRTKANLPSPSGRGVGGEGPHCSSHAYPPTELRDFARALRNNQTDAEHLMWRMLRDRRIAGAKFRRQHPVPPYVLDFYCHELTLAIELDGGQHGEPTGLDRDRQRDAALSERGLTVLRFWNHEVLNETEAVLERIYQTVTERVSPSPQTPLPKGEGFGGLPKEIADLFPDSFEDSELGEIPKGWEVKTLGELLELAYGKALRADNRQHGTVPVYGSNGQVGWHHKKLVTGPGIIVGRKGNPGVVKWVPTDFFAIDTTFYVVPTDRCRSLHFLFYALKPQDLGSLGADSAVPGLNRNLAYMSKQIVPSGPDPVFDAFDSFVQPLFERIYKAENETRTLAALRDALLPKLISGEVRVEDAERFIVRAV